MDTSAYSRRRLLSLGLISCAAATIPGEILAKPKLEPAWVSELTTELRKLSTWVRTSISEGSVEFQCGLDDAAKWAGCADRIAGPGNRVRAAGNELSFSRNGHAVRIILHAVA